jgi:iron complex outermembrane receptor protein
VGRFFGKFNLDRLTVTAAVAERRKGIATGAFGISLSEPRNQVVDTTSFLSVEQQATLAPNHDLTARLSYGQYDGIGKYVVPIPGQEANLLPVVAAHGAWWNTELKLVSELGLRHKLVSGVEFQQNLRQDQVSYLQAPYVLIQNDHRSSRRFGIYLQDEFRFSDALSFTLGARLDKYSDVKGEANPRAAVVYRSSPETVWKLMYGSAFRAPNVYERYYRIPGVQAAAEGTLRPERIRTLEGVVEHYLQPKTRVLASLYSFQMKDLVGLRPTADDPLIQQFQQVGGVRASGAEFELAHQWDNGASLRTSLSLQRSHDDAGAEVLGSPRRMLKLNLSAPLPGLPVHAGFEFQAMSARKAQSLDPDTGAQRIRTVSGFNLANLTLSTPLSAKGWDFSVGLYNLFDRKYSDPVGFDSGVPARDSMEQDGRTVRLKAVWHF